jgi:aldose 1-epimerase
MENTSSYLTVSQKEICKANETEQVVEFTLENKKTNFKFSFLNLGGVISQILTLDKDKNYCDVVLGYKDKSDYLENPMYFNAIVGRVCGRISDSKFTLNGKEYSLFANSGKNHLHGGKKGLSHRIWDVQLTEHGAKLSYISDHMDEGYPGQIKVEVDYHILKDEAGYLTQIKVVTDQSTPINFNTHEYFDLSGGKEQNALKSHNLMIPSKLVLEMGGNVLPSGKISLISESSAFNFTKSANLYENRNKSDIHWDYMKGFDHSFVLGKWKGDQSLLPNSKEKIYLETSKNEDSPPLAAVLSCELSGIQMEVRTDQDAIHLYGADYLNPSLGGIKLIGRQNQVYQGSDGICLECQGFPNAVNQKGFPSIILHPNETYKKVIIHKFRNI